MKRKNIAITFAILAAALYSINVPLSKILLGKISTTIMASLLYLGAGFGMLILVLFSRILGKESKKDKLTRKELPYTIAMVVLDIFAPILLMLGILNTNSANVSLLNNFEIVATSLIAMIIFKEKISKKLCLSIILVVISTTILSFEGIDAFTFNKGSLYVLGACICWGFENNCTKMISNKSSEEIVIIKGIFSGLGILALAFLVGESLPSLRWIVYSLILGFISYGLSINFYIMAQKDLGAAKTSAYYSVAPFLGITFSLLLLGELPDLNFYIALLTILLSTIIMVKDTLEINTNY